MAGGCGGAGPQPRARGQGAEAAEVAEVLVVVPGVWAEAGVGVHPQLPPPQRLPPDVPDQAHDGAAGRGRGGGGGGGGVTRG